MVLAIAFAATTPGGTQYAFPTSPSIVIYVFSFDQGVISAVLRVGAAETRAVVVLDQMTTLSCFN